MKQDPTFSIGRGRECDLVIADDSVSRLHAKITFTADGKIFLVDCHSTHGTVIRSGSHRIPVHQEFVSPTDSLEFGEVTWTVKELVDALRLKFPAMGPVALAEPGKAPTTQGPHWAKGKKLVRCSCGAVKTKNERCPLCKT
jgi:hypothetical protein